MIARIHRFLLHRITVIAVLLLSTWLTYSHGGAGYLFGLVIALAAWATGRFDWHLFGVYKPNWPKSMGRAVAYAVLIFILVDGFIQPICEIIFGAIDLSSFDWLKGNLIGYLIFIVFMWIVAGFGEEFFYRGYLTKQVALLLGGNQKGWLASAVITSVLFGLAHTYQGPSGVITTGLIGFLFALLFYKNQKNLVLAMLTHGFYDMIGLTFIYLDSERVLADWIIPIYRQLFF